jgi:energy-coupling factor transporter ATP-binding protein EcfA2
MAPFETADANRFFGRSTISDTLITRVREQRFVAVVGASGAGKSSLLRAGLVARANTTAIAQLTPGSDPIAECAIALGSLAGVPATEWRAALLSSTEGLHLQVRQLVADRPRSVDVLLVIDQFEELFTLCRDEQRRDRFIATLIHAVRHPESRLRVVVGLRSDFYAHCLQQAGLVDMLTDSQVLLGPMSAPELQCAITQPAVRAGYVVEGALLATLLADAAGQPGVLPLLSHALLETWRRRRGTTLTLSGYQAGGGITHAVARTAEQVYERLDEPGRRLAKTLFLRLTAAGEGADSTKRMILRDDVDMADQHTTELLDHFTRARLLTVDGDRVEVAHEALIRCWPRLQNWLAEDRAGLRIHRQLTDAARTWDRAGRDRDTLYRGSPLAAARDWETTTDAVLSPRERAFLTAGLAAESTERGVSARRTRWLRILVAVLSVLLLVAGTAVGFAVVTERVATAQQHLAIAQEVLIQAQSLAASDAPLADQLAVAAYRLAPNEQTRSGLFNADDSWPGAPPSVEQNLDGTDDGEPDLSVLADDSFGELFVATGSAGGYVLPGNEVGIQGRFPGGDRIWVFTDPTRPQARAAVGGVVPSVLKVDVPGENSIVSYPAAFNARTRYLATGGLKGGALWHLAVGAQPTWSAELPGIATPVVFSPDGRTLAAIGADGKAELWDVSRPDRPRGLSKLLSGPGAMEFSPDGRTLATAGSDGTVRLWDVTRAAHPRVLVRLYLGADSSLAFSPDGRTLATGGIDGTVRLWNVTTPRYPVLSATLDTNKGITDTLVFSPDGSTLAVAGGQETTRLWDIRNPVRPGLVGVLNDAVGPIAFGPDGHSLAVLDQDGSLWLRETDPERLVAQLCQDSAAGQHGIGPGLWRQYFPGVPYRQPCG